MKITSGKNIYIGNNAEEHLVLGETLVDILSELIDTISTLTVGTSNGPSTAPLNVSKFKVLQKKLKRILSKNNLVK